MAVRWREVEPAPEGQLPGRPIDATPPYPERPARPKSPRPKRKRWGRRLFRFSATGAFASLVFIIAHLFFGPRADAPVLDPVEKINRKARALPQNAAPLYRRALDEFVPAQHLLPEDMKRVNDDEIRPTLIAHVQRNDACLRQVAAATGKPACLFTVEWSERGLIEIPGVLRLREISRLLRLQLALAASEHDLPSFRQTLRQLDRMGRHLTEQPTPIAYMVGMAALHAVQEGVLEPATWPTLDESARVAYLENVGDLFLPPPNLSQVLRLVRDEICWIARQRAGAQRIIGEIDRYMAPLLRFADLPVEEQASLDHPIRTRMQELWNRWPNRESLPQQVASRSVPTMRVLLRAVDLRVMLIAMQRGNLAAASILRHQALHGALPADLEFLGAEATDVYTGRLLAYRPRDGSFLLYSYGLDGDDDGGRHVPRFGRPPPDADAVCPPDGDYVFWPLTARATEE